MSLQRGVSVASSDGDAACAMLGRAGAGLSRLVGDRMGVHCGALGRSQRQGMGILSVGVTVLRPKTIGGLGDN